METIRIAFEEQLRKEGETVRTTQQRVNGISVLRLLAQILRQGLMNETMVVDEIEPDAPSASDSADVTQSK